MIGELSLDEFSPDAAAAGAVVGRRAGADAREFLGGLPSLARRDDAELFHGSARDPVWEYVLSHEAAAATLALTSAPLVLVGHSHVPARARPRPARASREGSPATAPSSS